MRLQPDRRLLRVASLEIGWLGKIRRRRGPCTGLQDHKALRDDVSRSTSIPIRLHLGNLAAYTATELRAASPTLKWASHIVGNRVGGRVSSGSQPCARPVAACKGRPDFYPGPRLDHAGGRANTLATRRGPQNSSQVPEDAPKPLATFFVGNLLSTTGAGRLAGAAIIRAMPRKAVD